MVEAYIQKPVEVKAVEFRAWQTRGGLETFLKFIKQLSPFYVPRGYEYEFRRKPQEFDRSRGDVLDDAPPYLIIEIDGVRSRADVGTWFVQYETGNFVVMTHEEFTTLFNKVDLPTFKN